MNYRSFIGLLFKAYIEIKSMYYPTIFTGKTNRITLRFFSVHTMQA